MAEEPSQPSPLQKMLDDLYPILDHVRFFHRFMEDVVPQYPESKKVAAELRNEYALMLDDEYKHFTYRLAALAVMLLDKLKERPHEEKSSPGGKLK